MKHFDITKAKPGDPFLDLKKIHSTKSNNGLKSLPKKFYAIGFVVILATLFISGFLAYAINLYPVAKLGSRETTLNCDYAGKKLSISVNTYANIDNYYRYNTLKRNNINNSKLEKMVYSNPGDTTIKDLSQRIQALGKSNNLNDDQVVELTTCFVQNIPYNDAKASKVLSSNSKLSAAELAQFPYETLHKNSGICTDKTYLASALLKELGYSTALLLFPDAQHMALGIGAPGGYTDFNSKYIYMETTATGWAPGSIPEEINNVSGKPILSLNSLSDITATTDPSTIKISKETNIGNPNLIVPINNGKVYNRIIPIRNLANKISAEVDNLISKKQNLSNAYSELTRRNGAQQSAYNYYVSVPSTTLSCGYKYSYSYSYLYPYSYSLPSYSCNNVTNPYKQSAYYSYESALYSYNSQVNFYNRLIDDYNSSLATFKKDYKDFLSYQYN
ncbi:MAG: transglutaminase-like domain-containing protein [Candidatus Saccharimonadales bacterium]